MLETKHQRKALMETVVILAVLIALMLISGLKYLDPPPPGNIAVNFGTSETGRGQVQPEQPVNKPKPVTPPEPVKQVKEQVLTNDQTDAPVISPKKKKTKSKPQPKPKPKPKPSKETTDVLDNIFNAPADEGGEGDDQTFGDKGNPEGDKNAKGYYGAGKSGGGGDGNYFLGNRKPVYKAKPAYKCNESGTVVVIITVDRNGNVIKAVKGRGTTAAPCLTEAAIQAAYKTKWEKGDMDKQVGKIIFRFKLQ